MNEFGVSDFFKIPWPFLSTISNITESIHSKSCMSSLFLFFIVEFQWFFIVLSVLRGIIFAIYDHLFPNILWAKKRIHSSWKTHYPLFINGLRWLCHLYRHCLPSLPSTNFAMKDHFWAPYFWTRFLTRLSYCSVHGFLLSIFGGLLDLLGECRWCGWNDWVFLIFLPICLNLKNLTDIWGV